MRRHRPWIPCLFLFLAGSTTGCENRPEGWTPVMEETSTAFLESETDRALEHVRTALTQLDTDPARAEAALTDAESSLEHLRGYYLPLLQARERAYNAYRALFLNDRARVTDELDRIEALLEGMAESVPEPRLQELQSLAESLADARLALEVGPEEGAAALETLARHLNQAALKGDLILQR